jgi:hypothetical protein
MSIDPFLAQMIMDESVEDTLREAERARLAKMVQKSKGTRPFLPAGIQFIRDWWEGENGYHQPTMDNMKQRKRHQNVAG